MTLDAASQRRRGLLGIGVVVGVALLSVVVLRPGLAMDSAVRK